MRGLLVYLRRHYPEARRYVLDSTDDPDMVRMIPDALQVTGNTMPDRLRDSNKTLVWTPKNGKLPITYNTWFEMLNDSREPQIVIIDEIASITGEALEGLEGMLKQLRKHGGTVICLTQEIGKVDTTIFGQLTHFVQFFLNPKSYDLSQARNFLGIEKHEQRPPRFQHGFFYRKTRGNYPMKEYRDLHEFFNSSI